MLDVLRQLRIAVGAHVEVATAALTPPSAVPTGTAVAVMPIHISWKRYQFSLTRRALDLVRGDMARVHFSRLNPFDEQFDALY
mmetsp:Transcript_22145/g.30901  ORF Transcript_22145/g.30901 Transcript_22145/m.30901 type:complete len:83 (+) Transcript_22145:161-409(+)